MDQIEPTLLSEEELVLSLSNSYKHMELTRPKDAHLLPEDRKEVVAFKKLFDEYEKRHPLPKGCWYGMTRDTSKEDHFSDKAVWVPYVEGRAPDLPVPHWVTVINEWTDTLGWRIMDLHKDRDQLRRAITCYLETKGKHEWSNYTSPDMANCFNNPFGNDLYSHCYRCTAVIRRESTRHSNNNLRPKSEIDVTDILKKHLGTSGGSIPTSGVNLTYDHPGHVPDCTWPCYVAVGEVPPGQSFWGEVNYSYCQEKCGIEPAKKVSLITRFKKWWKYWFVTHW